MSKSAKNTKPAPKVNANKKFATKTGKRDPNVRRKVVRMRKVDEMSWAAIGGVLGVSPKTVRSIFDEQEGEGAHFDHRPLPGGRPHPVAHKGQCVAHGHQPEDHDDEEGEQAAA